MLVLDYQHATTWSGWERCGLDPKHLAPATASHGRQVPGFTAAGNLCSAGMIYSRPGHVKHSRTWAKHSVPVVSNRAMLPWFWSSTPNRPRGKSMDAGEKAVAAAALVSAGHRYLLRDGHHPNAAGHAQLARIVIHALLTAQTSMVKLQPEACQLPCRPDSSPQPSERAAAALCHMGESMRALQVADMRAPGGFRYDVSAGSASCSSHAHMLCAF